MTRPGASAPARRVFGFVLALATAGAATACSEAPAPPSLRDARGEAVALDPIESVERAVFEPLSQARQTFRGLAAGPVLRRVLGELPSGGLVLARCRDGYRAEIPVQWFEEHDALFAFDLVGEPDFAVTSAASGARITLEPFYLVWSSTVGVSASAFAYQVEGLEHRATLPAVLRSPAAPAGGAQAFRRHCTGCHALGGYGGQMGPELLEPIPISRWVDDRWLRRWILEPESMRVGTAMPGLPRELEDREARADAIVAFLRWLDVRSEESAGDR